MLRTEMENAKQNLDESALRRKDLYNRDAKERPLSIGTRVLMRNRIQGRNKIQDIWNSTPYKVIQDLGDNVYSVQLADGTGPTKNVTRRELLDTVELVSRDSEDETSISDSDSVKSDESFRAVLDFRTEDVHQDNGDNHHHSAQETLVKLETPVPRRRSSRSIAGKYSNPHHLPRSTVRTQTAVTSESNFQELSQAVANLGATLGETISKTWYQYKH